jgi:hypothetical protein
VPARTAGLAVVAAFALSTVYFTGNFPPHPTVNELSRFQAVVSFVERGTFAIDDAIRVMGDHQDKAAAGGHFYSNKGPGLIFAGIPVYRALRTFFPEPRSGTAAIFVWMRLLTVSVVCLLAIARFWLRVARAPNASPSAPLVVLAVAFGTPFLFYARSFFSHAWTASLLFLSWDLLQTSSAPMRRRRATALLAAAGFLAGWAAISEYAVAPIALLLALRAVSGRFGRALLPFAAGAAIPLALLLAYQAVCFGSPWVLSSAREAHPPYAELLGRGLFGIGSPSLAVAAQYLFHPNRGVLLASPFLLWSFAGFFRWARSREERADFYFTFFATGVFFLLLTGAPYWEGGWCLGSRYLLPALFFAALPIRYALGSPLSRGLFAAAVVFSVANHFLLTSSFPYFPPSVSWPAANGSWFFLSHGWVAPSLASMAGAGALASLLLPAAATALLLLLCLRAVGPTVPPRTAAAVLALGLFAATLVFPPPLPAWDREWREGTLRIFVAR